MSKVEDLFQAVADELGINYYEVVGINQSFSNPDYPYCKVETRSYGDFFIEGARYLRMTGAVKLRKGIEPVTLAKSECCNKDPKAIGWNPYNEVVQCHHCGHIYVKKVYGKLSKRK